MENRKEDIIIELGGQLVRVGIVSDRTPRKTIPAEELATFRSDIAEHEYEIKVQEILHSIFYTHINSTVANKTVIVLERVFTDRRILEVMAKLLFKKFKIEKLQFGLSCVTPLYLSARMSGVVVLGGFSAVEIMPVFESYPLMQNYKYVPSGTNVMTKVIKDELLLLNPETPNQVYEKMNNEYYNDLKNLYSNMNLVETKSEQVVTLNFKKNKLKLRPANISYSNIFGNPENEQYNIAYMFLESLEKIDCKMLDKIVDNIILAGGLWRVKGMQQYFKNRIKEYLPKFKRLQAFRLLQKIKFVSWSFNPSQVSWIGCSVGASVRSVDALCLKKADYLQSGFVQKIMQNYYLSG